MSQEDYDGRGRLIAQAMWTEMEKISRHSRLAHSLTNRAHEAARVHRRVQKAEGWKRFVPFTSAHRTADATRIQARRARRAAEKRVQYEREGARSVIRSGKGNTEGMINMLESSKGKPLLQKTVGEIVNPPVTQIKTEKPPLITKKRALAAGALGIGGTAAVLGGKKIYDDKQKKTGYGNTGGY